MEPLGLWVLLIIQHTQEATNQIRKLRTITERTIQEDQKKRTGICAQREGRRAV